MKPLNVFGVEFNGFNLVEASAGTGKTYNITSLYIRALIETKALPSEILVLTFTEDATAELKQRIRERIQDCISVLSKESDIKDDDFLNELSSKAPEDALNHLKRALFSFDEAVISTIHGFCQKLLREFSIELNVQSDFEILNDTSELIQENIDSSWRNFIKENSDSEQGRSLISFLLSEKINPENLAKLVRDVFNKPYADLKPERLSGTEKEKLINQARDAFYQIKNAWEEDEQQLRDIIFSGKMHGSWYKEDSFKEHFFAFRNWINSPTAQLSGFDKLVSFGASKIERGANKGYEPKLPKICELIDEYLAIAEQMDQVRTDFIISVIEEAQLSIEDQKKNQNLLTFDDLLQKVNQNLTSDIQKRIAEKYPIALVDEFQDTDPIQYSIFSKLFKNLDSTLFMIGDPKQAIYGFRGADLFTYFQATDDIDSDKKYSLDQNHRSNEGMISAVNSIFGKHEDPFVFSTPQFRPAKYPSGKISAELLYKNTVCSPFTFVDCNFNGDKNECVERVCDYVSSQVFELLNKEFRIGDELVQPKDIAILVRKGSEAISIQEALLSKGIKSTLKTKESVFKSTEGRDLRILLKAVSNTNNKSLIHAALVTSLIGYSAGDLIKLQKDERKWDETLNTFVNANKAYDSKGIVATFKELDSFFGIREILAKQEQPERRLTNLDHLLELLLKREVKKKNSLQSSNRFLKKKINEELKASEDELLKLESDSELVTISTLHSSKGLQYSIVFTPFLWDDYDSSNSKGIRITEYHDDENALCIDFSSDPSQEVVDKSKFELLADSIRLNYVAFTRAKYACIIPFGDYDRGITRSSLFATVCDSSIIFDKKIKKNEKKELLEKSLNDLKSNGSIDFLTAIDKLDISLKDEITNREAEESIEKLSISINKRTDLFDFKRMLSFSSLTSSHHSDDYKDYDEFQVSKSDDLTQDHKDDPSKLTFPKGAETGNLLHYIFEDISFKSPNDLETIISEKMDVLGFENKWGNVVQNWVLETLQHSIQEQLKLSDLEDSDLLKEMEFYFPVNDLSDKKLVSIVRDQSKEETNPVSLSGFMKGFIDLIFRHQGKYYILDYKSNFLGDSEDDYSSDQLHEAMFASNYDLQYHIYTVALIKYLTQRMPDFRYDKDFGGVIYLFLRGITETQGSGVFFHKPAKETIREIELLIGENH